jgi:hypothetical protein
VSRKRRARDAGGSEAVDGLSVPAGGTVGAAGRELDARLVEEVLRRRLRRRSGYVLMVDDFFQAVP